MVDLIQVGFFAIIVFIVGLYYLFFHKPDKEKNTEALLTSPIDKKPLGVCAAKGGLSWAGYVRGGKVYSDGTADLELTDGTRLVRIRDENIRPICSNINIATGDGIAFVSNVDKNNRICDWNLGKIAELSSITLERIRQDAKNQVIADVQFGTKLKKALLSKAEEAGVVDDSNTDSNKSKQNTNTSG